MTQRDHRTRLMLVIHNHQPVGNFDFVFEKATDKAYAPFVELLAEHPRVRVGLHFTGPLLEWLEGHRPALLATVRELCQRGQVEVLGGGWSEPMLSVLHRDDALGQLRMMRSECERLFGAAPRGMWLAERVWDPSLPSLLTAAGVEYTLLDDTHFRYAGLLDSRLVGHYVTENAGDAVAIFPIDRELRYAIPFHKPEEAINAIRGAGAGNTVTYGDDGEKFGIWPQTHEWVWGQGWLAQFFALLEDGEGEIELILPSEQLDQHRPAGRVYLPTASYHEMGEWTLAPKAGRQLLELKKRLKALNLEEAAEPFLHGGIWSGFLSKYPESNILHKKMLRVSERVAEAPAETPAQERALRALYRGQCNCPYWHGLFGGLYLPHLRHAVYQQLVEAEALVREGLEGARVSVSDLDRDLQDEVELETASMSVWIDPTAGGQLVALDDRARRVSLGHVLTRRPETYHQDLLELAGAEDEDGQQAAGEGDEGITSPHDRQRSKVPEIEKRLIYDAYDRRVAVDHLLPAEADPAALETGAETTALADLVRLRYAIRHTETDGGWASAILIGDAPLLDGSGGRVQVSKRFNLTAPAELRVEYELILLGDGPSHLETLFGVENALALVPGDDNFALRRVDTSEQGSPQERGRWSNVAALTAGTSLGGTTVELLPSRAAEVSWFPVETVSQSEDGAELVYQGTVIVTAWPMTLEAREPQVCSLTLRLC